MLIILLLIGFLGPHSVRLNPVLDNHQFDIIKSFEFKNEIINSGGSFYRLPDFDYNSLENRSDIIAKEFSIRDIFGNEKGLDEFTLEINARFENQDDRDIQSYLFALSDIKLNKKNLIQLRATTYKILFSLNNDESVWEFEYDKILNGEWHKILLKFSNGDVKLWLDCEPLKLVQDRHDKDALKKIRINEDTSELNVEMITRRGSKGFDLNKMIFHTIDQNSIEPTSCTDLPSKILNTEPFIFDVLDSLKLDSLKNEENSKTIFQLNTPIEANFSSEAVLQPDLVEDFTIETILKFNNTFDSYFNVIKITDSDSNSFIRIFVTSTNVIFVKLNDLDKITKVKYETDDKKIFDGNWHKLVVSFSKGSVEAWLDCEKLKGIVNDPEVNKIRLARKNISVKLIGNYEGVLENLKFDFEKLKIFSGKKDAIDVNKCTSTLVKN